MRNPFAPPVFASRRRSGALSAAQKRLAAAATGVDADRAPKEAVKLFIEAHQPERDYPELRARGRRSPRR